MSNCSRRTPVSWNYSETYPMVCTFLIELRVLIRDKKRLFGKFRFVFLKQPFWNLLFCLIIDEMLNACWSVEIIRFVEILQTDLTGFSELTKFIQEFFWTHGKRQSGCKFYLSICSSIRPSVRSFPQNLFISFFWIFAQYFLLQIEK